MPAERPHVCPWWMGYALLIPIRRFRHNPEKILKPYLKAGMTAMDYGSAMGYFSIPMAKMTGSQGKVYCVDIQPVMLEKLKARAVKNGVAQVIEPLLVGESYNPEALQNKLDFMLLFAVVHEVPNQEKLFQEVAAMLKPGGKVVFAEPRGHVTPADFEQSLQFAGKAGLQVSNEKPFKGGLNVVLSKPVVNPIEAI